ncbi:hypothetical protein PHMEG_00010763 [Phytophthora megakarya]|uniref:Reverse transcriptase Ty1/copia-type domain-containing protein n=1 Tax=Phytophthora megakarya TaxID=4795 RepID=A0A225WCX7_9STRA|nr:hypothetical protein PHMEG_00010763 [Phytophthora megakarya]
MFLLVLVQLVKLMKRNMSVVPGKAESGMHVSEILKLLMWLVSNIRRCSVFYNIIKLANWITETFRYQQLKIDEHEFVKHLKDRLVIHDIKQIFGVSNNETYAPTYKFITSLYGLKQGPHVWDKTLHIHLIALGFSHLERDCELYCLREQGDCYTTDCVW